MITWLILGLYDDHCNDKVWNNGNGMGFEDFDIPIMIITQAADVKDLIENVMEDGGNGCLFYSIVFHSSLCQSLYKLNSLYLRIYSDSGSLIVLIDNLKHN